MTIQTPDWVKDALFYQIFPDRFARSARVPKPNNLQPWDAAPTQEGYWGGDLPGIVEHLDYIQSLGVNALYLTPIFQSASNHRYHTHDYYKVDPLLGGNEGLRELVEACHTRNMRIVLDGVFNHASRGFFQFNDILEHGPHSAWLDWFIIEGWPLRPYTDDGPANYVSWVGNRALPKLNTDNPQVREFIMQVGEYWLREFHIDGWRLDVPAEITTPGFWEEFRVRVKKINPDAYIVGEIWREARAWLQGDRFDATMNYEFTSAVIASTAGERVSHALTKDRSYDPYPGIDAPQFAERIQRLLDLYNWDVTRVQLNSLDSHDTARLLSIARGDKATLRLAALMQMTYPGAPCIYYGDEIALRGTLNYDSPIQDPDARWPFPWHDESLWDMEMLAYYKALIAIRNAHPVLRHGAYRSLFAAGGVYLFARHDEETTLVIALNVEEGQRDVVVPVGAFIADGSSPLPLFGHGRAGTVRNGEILFALPPRAGAIFTVPKLVRQAILAPFR